MIRTWHLPPAVVASGLASVAWFAGCAALAAPPPAQPVQREGSCPGGYYSSGAYCMPSSSARFAIGRNGSCPGGYYSSGNYCVASGDSSRAVIPRTGSCPGGWYSSGNYCLSSR